MHSNTWVVVANSNSCKIYKYSVNPHKLSLIKELQHLENKLKDTDLTSSKPGRYQSDNGAHGAYSQQTDPKMNHIESFIREVAHDLDHSRSTNDYQHLILIMPPKIKGIFHEHANKHVYDLIKHTIEKDVVNLQDGELLDVIKQHI